MPDSVEEMGRVSAAPANTRSAALQRGGPPFGAGPPERP